MEYFQMAAKLNHTQALEHVAFAYILGDYLPQDTEKAKVMFQDLAARGSPKGQLVSILRERLILLCSSQTKFRFMGVAQTQDCSPFCIINGLRSRS